MGLGGQGTLPSTPIGKVIAELLDREMPTKFFIPNLEGSTKQGEELYQAIRKSAEEHYPLGDRRIRSITFRDIHLGKKKGKPQTKTVTVGRDDPYGIGVVFAILEATKYPSHFRNPPSEGYLICTTKRGVLTDAPYVIPTADAQVYDTEYFDPPDPET